MSSTSSRDSIIKRIQLAIRLMNVEDRKNKVKGLETSPSCTSETGLSAVNPISSKPIIARNKPIPAPIPSFKLFGIEFISQALSGVNEII